MFLGERQSTGGTRREHLEQLVKSGGQRSAKLNLPQLSPEGQELRGLFAELSAGRGSSGMGGAEPIRPTDVLAWSELTGQRVERWQWQAVRQIDEAFRDELARQAEQRSKLKN